MSFFNYPVYEIPAPEEIRRIDCTLPIVILVGAEDFGDSQSSLLTKILQSVNQSMEDVQIEMLKDQETVKLSYSPNDSSTIQVESPLILVFGFLPAQCCLQVEQAPYHLISINNKSYLFSLALSQLPDQPESRRALWTALKKYYKLS